MKVRLVDIDLNDTSFMSRLEFDDNYISKLAVDMKQFGQRNPVGLQRNGNMYQLVYGWCRVKAANLLGWETIEARIFEGLSNLQAQLHNISDNVTHESLSTLEIAYQVKKLRMVHGVTAKEIAKLYGDKVQLVYNLLTLTRMNEEIRQAVHRGEIGLTHAIEINKFPVSNQLEILEETINEGLSTSKLKRLRSSRIQSEVVRKVTSRLSEKELDELVIQSEYKRFQKFLLTQVDAESVYQNSREVVVDWISALDALRRAYNWKPPKVSERVNMTIFTIVRARAHLEEESDIHEIKNEPITKERV
jgi:ParB family chromosome partitioning protein